MSKSQEFQNEIDIVMRVMRHAQAAVRSRFIQEVVPNRLTIVQFNALQHLHWYGRDAGMSVSELGEHLGLAHNTTSGLVSRLEKHGWVVRRKCEEDRRRARIQLTSQSKQFFQKAVEHAADFWQSTFGQLTPPERENLIESLKQLKQVMAKPVWPSYAQLHPRDEDHLQKRFATDLEELAQAKLKLVGMRLILAQLAEKQNAYELAAYLNQAASEEIRHTNHLLTLLGHTEDIEMLLATLIHEDNLVYEELMALLETVPHATASAQADLLQQMAQDTQRYKRWFQSIHKQMNQ